MLESVFLKVKPYDSVPPLFLAATSPVGGGGRGGLEGVRKAEPSSAHSHLKVEAAEVGRKSGPPLLLLQYPSGPDVT